MKKSDNTTAKNVTKKVGRPRKTEKAEAKKEQAPVEAKAEQTSEQAQEEKQPRKVIGCVEKFGRFYVYFKHIKPEENVGCGCKTAQKALNYCRLLKARHNAYLPQEVFNMLVSKCKAVAVEA